MPDEKLTEYQVHLVETHMDLAHRIADDFWRRSKQQMDRSEVIAMSYQGLVTAAVRFDTEWRPDPPDPKYDPFLAFGAFAKRRIAGAILDWQRTQDHVPRRQRATYKTLQQHGHGTGRTAEELSDITGLPADKIRAIVHAVESSALSLDEAIADVGDPDSVERSVVVGNVQDAMADAIENFSPAQRSVVVLRYYVGMDFPMIAAELGVSVMNVRTMHSEAIYLLHDVMKDAAK